MVQDSSCLAYLLVILFTVCTVVKSKPLSCPLPPELADRIHTEPTAIESASKDYGNIVHDKPAAVLYPLNIEDIQSLIKSSYNCSVPFGISARGNGHSVNGQDMALNGVVVDMKRLKENKSRTGIKVSKEPLFADVGGEQLWTDVLNATLKHGVAPVSWTDFLPITVGGTLSNAGISGQTFRVGPQISNVYEMDVITGKGELVTCSASKNSKLFYAVLGGLGQFGIITRARIALEPAPKKVSWIRALYSDFSAFATDQEFIISQSDAVDYMEGFLLLDNGTPNSWLTSAFPAADLPKIGSLVKQHSIIYVLEISKKLKDDTTDKELQKLIKGLSFVPGFISQHDVSYVEFLSRVGIDNQKPQSHPWLHLYIPKSRISDFNSGVLVDIIAKRNITIGPFLIYAMNRNKWDARTSAIIPDDEDVFYLIASLQESRINEWQAYEDQNKATVQYCDKAGIKTKQYLSYYTTQEQWINHFGSKWTTFQKRKVRFDPKMILSPGQKIFNNNYGSTFMCESLSIYKTANEPSRTEL